MGKSFIFINNIPSPYRNYQFNLMHSCGINLLVYHEAKTQKDRNWKFLGDEIKYNNYFDKYYIRPPFNLGTFNPIILYKLLKSSRETDIVIAGWGGINQILICIMKRLGLLKNTLHIWCEANYLDIQGPKEKVGLNNAIRKFCMKSSDGKILIPGIMAKKALSYFGITIETDRFVNFPNIIEDENFGYGHYKPINGLPIFISPVRIIERLKGVINFFEAIGSENIKKALFLIAGDGSDKSMYEEYIKAHGYGNNIKLLGFLNSEQMEKVYSQANVMLLPSFYDPSPLSLVEATKKGLVILASNHCGNHFEAVECGRNGESFDPLDKVEIKKKFEKLLNDIDEWPLYSQRSIEIYKERFHPNVVLGNFIDCMGLTNFNK